MIRVVMKKIKLLHFGFESQCHDVIQTGVTPANVFLIFCAVVLGIHDEHIHAAQETDDLSFLALQVFEG